MILESSLSALSEVVWSELCFQQYFSMGLWPGVPFSPSKAEGYSLLLTKASWEGSIVELRTRSVFLVICLLQKSLRTSLAFVSVFGTEKEPTNTTARAPPHPKIYLRFSKRLRSIRVQASYHLPMVFT